MSHHEIRVVKVDVHVERSEIDPGEPTDGEEEDEAECVEHRCVECDRTLVQGRHPVEDLDRGGNRHLKVIAEKMVFNKALWPEVNMW